MFSRRQDEFKLKQYFASFDILLPYGIAYGSFTDKKGRKFVSIVSFLKREN